MLRTRFLAMACLAALSFSPVRADDVKSETQPRPADKILNAGVTSKQTLDINAAIAELQAEPNPAAASQPADKPAESAVGAKPAGPVKAAEAEKPAAPPEPTLTAAINLGTQHIVVLENGQPKYDWAISSGTAEHPTPRGTFRPQWTAKMWFSKKYDNAPMPNAVFIHDGVAIHATYATGMLGQPASHGCIRLAPANAATFYKLVGKHGIKNTKVSIFGTPKWRAPAVASGRMNDDDGRVRQVAQRQDSGVLSWFLDTPKYTTTSAYNPGLGRQVYRRPPPPPGYRYADQIPVRGYRRTYGGAPVTYVRPQPRRVYYNRYSGW